MTMPLRYLKRMLLIIENDHSILTKDCLAKEWQEINKKSGINTTGHCYAASEAIYHLFGGKDVFIPQQAKDENGFSHWFLKIKETGEIVDPTASQYTKVGLVPPYDKAKGRGFQQQSDRSKTIIKRLVLKF